MDSKTWIKEGLWAATANEAKTAVADSVVHYIGAIDWASKMNHYNFEDTIFGFNETDTTPLSLLNFTRGVATTHDVAHLESRCNACGFRISALDETLDTAEREHATRCAGPPSE